ncbi:MAG: metal-dependent hydrolase [Pyrinomonadaceae bacterium]
MPTIFSHAIFASAFGQVFRSTVKRARFWVLTCFCAILPDADVIGFAFGIKYGSMLGHRGITHSISFAVLVGLTVSYFFTELEIARWKFALYFALVTVSHPLLDMLTNGGLGIALLAPFSAQRFFFPWRPIEVSPIGADFFSERGSNVIVSEALWIWLPSILIFTVLWLINRKKAVEFTRAG